MTDARLGERIATYRRRRGLSQVAVAGLVGRSESWLSQVERGVRDVDSLRVLSDLARVLRVDLGILTEVSATTGDVPHPTCDRWEPAARSLFDLPSTSAEDLDTVIHHAHRDYQTARYDQVLEALPGLVAALNGPCPPALLASGYTVVAKTFSKLGASGPALTAADRGWRTSLRAGDLRDIGMTAREVVSALLPNRRPDAERLALGTAAQVAGSDEPARLSVEGALWLIAAVVAARNGEDGQASDRLDRADDLAARLGVDANHRWTAFGPTNVAIHRVSAAVELGDVEGAVAAASRIDLAALPPALASRRVQVQVDVAWAQSRRRRDAEAIVAMLEVERLAPQVVRHNAVAADTVRFLLHRARRGHIEAVRGLAGRAGITA